MDEVAPHIRLNARSNSESRAPYRVIQRATPLLPHQEPTRRKPARLSSSVPPIAGAGSQKEASLLQGIAAIEKQLRDVQVSSVQHRELLCNTCECGQKVLAENELLEHRVAEVRMQLSDKAAQKCVDSSEEDANEWCRQLRSLTTEISRWQRSNALLEEDLEEHDERLATQAQQAEAERHHNDILIEEVRGEIAVLRTQLSDVQSNAMNANCSRSSERTFYEREFQDARVQAADTISALERHIEAACSRKERLRTDLKGSQSIRNEHVLKWRQTLEGLQDELLEATRHRRDALKRQVPVEDMKKKDGPGTAWRCVSMPTGQLVQGDDRKLDISTLFSEDQGGCSVSPNVDQEFACEVMHIQSETQVLCIGDIPVALNLVSKVSERQDPVWQTEIQEEKMASIRTVESSLGSGLFPEEAVPAVSRSWGVMLGDMFDDAVLTLYER